MKKWVFIFCGVVFVLGSVGVSLARAQFSYIIVHAVNPEGVEIASIEGMDPLSVEIYEGETLIGYGASDDATCNQPIWILPGDRTITVKFNGMEVSQNIHLQEGEMQSLFVTFPRTSFDLASSIYDCNLHSSISGSWSGSTAIIDDTDDHPYTNWWTNTHFEEPVACGRSGIYAGEATLQFLLSGTSYSWYHYASYTMNPYGGSGCPPLTPYWASRTEPDSASYSIPSQNSAFTNWFLQYTVDGNVEFYVGDSLLAGSGILLINANSNSTVRVVIDEYFFVWGVAPAAREDGGSGTFDTKMSSVPYDVAGTGIQCKAAFEVYNAEHGTALPGKKMCRGEGDPPSGDADCDKAYEYIIDTYAFYRTHHTRNSIDNAGMTVIASVHYGSGLCRAAWEPSDQQMWYGDGCNIVADDVVAHEFTHGVTENVANLYYTGQSGAIDESFSDIWGEFVDLENQAGNDSPDVRWEIGEETGLPVENRRNMQDPTKYQDPDRTQSPYYYCGSDNDKYVHKNNGVGNKAAYLITDGGTFNGYTVSGLGISKTATLFYAARRKLTSAANYVDLYNALTQTCIDLGYSSFDCQQVQNALDATEMNQPPCRSYLLWTK